MNTYDYTTKSVVCREELALMANRHNLTVYFDFNIDASIFCFRFVLGECEIMKDSLDLSEGISRYSFELIEKNLEERIEKLRSKLNGKEGDSEMENKTEDKTLLTAEQIIKKRKTASSDTAYDKFNEDVLNYLREKFPNEPDTVIAEAAAFVSYRTASIILEMQAEMNSTMIKFYGDTTREMIETMEGLKR